MSKARVYISFDIDHDRELYERLLDQSGEAGFVVSGRSEPLPVAEIWDTSVRRGIRDADQVIVICGEHSEGSKSMSDEIRIAQEERIPYFLLWGRSEAMCTKPVGAKNAEGMYRWSWANLQAQIAYGLRLPRTPAIAAPAGEEAGRS